MWLQEVIYKFGTKNLILQKFCYFSGTWDFYYLIPLRCIFSRNVAFNQYFWFPAVNWVTKWTKNVKFGCILFEPKFTISKDSSNNVFFLSEDYLWSKYQQDRLIIGWVGPKTPPKRDHFMAAESIRKTLKMFNYTTKNAILMKLTTLVNILIRSFICQNVVV